MTLEKETADAHYYQAAEMYKQEILNRARLSGGVANLAAFYGIPSRRVNKILSGKNAKLLKDLIEEMDRKGEK